MPYRNALPQLAGRLLVTDGADPLPVDYVAQLAHWSKVVKESGIKMQQ